ncbi:MAG TPA: hypothetical protein ENI52_04605 [Thermoplasmata archaeon]|nr:hypothetical protein [Thermoplasmata archaeon]
MEKKKKSKKYSITLSENISLNDSKLRGHLKSVKKTKNRKPIKEIKTTIRKNVEKKIVKDRGGERTKVLQIVLINGETIHFHDKTHKSIEIWHKEGNIYCDRNGNEYKKITTKDNEIIFRDKKEKEYRYTIG